MSTDTNTAGAPIVGDLLSRVAAHLRQLPKSQRADALVYAVTNLLQERRPMYYSL